MRFNTTLFVFAVTAAACSTSASAQVAGATTIGVEVSQLQVVAAGWSVRRQVLGKTLLNENGERVGRIEDLIVTPDGSLSFALVSAALFVGLDRHDVAIPVSQITIRDGNFVLPGATKAAVKAMPPFEYAK